MSVALIMLGSGCCNNRRLQPAIRIYQKYRLARWKIKSLNDYRPSLISNSEIILLNVKKRFDPKSKCFVHAMILESLESVLGCPPGEVTFSLSDFGVSYLLSVILPRLEPSVGSRLRFQ